MSPLTQKYRSSLDQGFVPAVLWNREYQTRVGKCVRPEAFALALERGAGDVSHFFCEILPAGSDEPITFFYLERLVKFLLWQQGGHRLYLDGRSSLVEKIRLTYSPQGVRAFDQGFMGEKVYGKTLEIIQCPRANFPEAWPEQRSLGRHLDGCRIGFDLGGSDRKCAAIIDGQVVFSEEIPWDPYFQTSPEYHYEGIRDSLNRAAAHLPRVDAIGGSAAGVYVDNEVRVASLFRGINPEDFDEKIRPLFKRLRQDWNNIPFEVINDGEVTALSGSLALNDSAVLGISMGTSQAGGYVTPGGGLTTWLNELAFAPIDYSPRAAADEWSGDEGCGVQYFSQQAVARLCTKAGIAFAEGTPLAERLVMAQMLVEKGDPRAETVFEAVGLYLGYTLPHYADFYDFRNVLLLGRVLSGRGGEIIIRHAHTVLRDEFSELAQKIRLVTPDEKQKRHGQAIAAASLPKIG